MAVVRELWESRDRIAQRRDVSPGKVLGDAAIVEAALALPANVHALSALPGYGQRMGRRQLDQWMAAVDRARALPENELPQPGATPAGPPPPRSWADKDPAAAARLSAARAAVSALAEGLNLPQENLIAPDTVRRLRAGSPRSGWRTTRSPRPWRATAPDPGRSSRSPPHWSRPSPRPPERRARRRRRGPHSRGVRAPSSSL